MKGEILQNLFFRLCYFHFFLPLSLSLFPPFFQCTETTATAGRHSEIIRIMLKSDLHTSLAGIRVCSKESIDSLSLSLQYAYCTLINFLHVITSWPKVLSLRLHSPSPAYFYLWRFTSQRTLMRTVVFNFKCISLIQSPVSNLQPAFLESKQIIFYSLAETTKFFVALDNYSLFIFEINFYAIWCNVSIAIIRNLLLLFLCHWKHLRSILNRSLLDDSMRKKFSPS